MKSELTEKEQFMAAIQDAEKRKEVISILKRAGLLPEKGAECNDTRTGKNFN